MLKHYNKKLALYDFIASITVGLIAFPLAISFATAIGIAPQAGFVATIIGGIVAAIFGGTRFIITGPNAIFFLVGIEAMRHIGPEGLFLATFIAGILLIIAGVMRLGIVIDYIPYSVIVSFTSGLAVVMVSTLLKECFGLVQPLKPGNFMVQSWALYFQNFRDINPYAILMSVCVIIPMRYLRNAQYPVFIPILILAATCTLVFGLPIETIGSRFKEFSIAWPTPAFPNIFSIPHVVGALPFALTITSVSLINSLLATTVVHDKTSSPVNANKELMAQGAANIAVSLFAGIPVSATISRTITNIQNNAKTPISAIFQSINVLLLLLFLSPLLKKIPFAALNAVFLSVAIDMLQLKPLWEQIKLPHGEALVCLVTFFFTIFLDNGVAILSGIVVAAFLFIHKMSQLTQIHSESFVSDIREGIRVYHIDGPFFFGAASRLKIILEEPHLKDHVIILDLKNMPLIDTSGSYIIKQLIKHNRQTEFIFTNVNKATRDFFEHIGLSKKTHYTETKDLDEAIRLAKEILRKHHERIEATS